MIPSEVRIPRYRSGWIVMGVDLLIVIARELDSDRVQPKSWVGFASDWAMPILLALVAYALISDTPLANLLDKLPWRRRT